MWLSDAQQAALESSCPLSPALYNIQSAFEVGEVWRHYTNYISIIWQWHIVYRGNSD